MAISMRIQIRSSELSVSRWCISVDNGVVIRAIFGTRSWALPDPSLQAQENCAVLDLGDLETLAVRLIGLGGINEINSSNPKN